MNAPSNSVGFNISGTLRPLWSLVRVPVLGVLLLLAPVVDTVCGALLLLGLLVSIEFKVSGAGAGFPFWSMIALSLGFSLFVILYHALIGMLSR
jgi:hypothetical protein